MDKKNIINAWIMVEHLTEGSINLKNEDILPLDSPENGDFYSIFMSNIKKGISRKKIIPGKGGIAVYLDIFKFNEVLDILRQKYNLQPTDEELHHSGDKFSIALYFNDKLIFDTERTFFTASGYIRRFHSVPANNYLYEYEEMLKTELIHEFYIDLETPKNLEVDFNAAMKKVMDKYGIKAENCRIQYLKNMENDAANLHSFFIEDLEKAKLSDSTNLEYFLFGNREYHINLDSNINSGNFNPYVFENILQPKKYPMGKFPCPYNRNLYFMQQVVVNLSSSYDDVSIISVNGPPGTGKTSLLKDIFADLIVKQAYDILRLTQKRIKGNENTRYFDKASIGELPEFITKNSIVVASSNNSAVQNIVNELPLIKEVENDAALEILKEVDYFFDLANSNLSSEWNDRLHKQELKKQPLPGEKKYWGMFSLEGGKSVNMSNIITSVEHIVDYLENDYESDEKAYVEFKELYRKVETLRGEQQKYFEYAVQYQNIVLELKKVESFWLQNEKEYEEKITALSIDIGKNDQQQKLAEQVLAEILQSKESLEASKKDLMIYLNILNAKKPGFFSGKRKKNEHRRQVYEIGEHLKICMDKMVECDGQIKNCRSQIEHLHNTIADNMSKQDKLRAEEIAQKNTIAQLEKKRLRLLQILKECSKPLIMTIEYDELQKFNPWFGDEFREMQISLFAMSLRVRKQFLYENVKNLKAAAIIWKKQNSYDENKKRLCAAAWGWINMAIPVISSTFASFSRMCKNLGEGILGHLFIDEAGQALPQASVGAIMRSRFITAVGDPSQIKPVLTLDSNVLGMLRKRYGISERYLSDSASTQTLTDKASQYGFYWEPDMSDASWIGIPLWVHRRCRYPMFTISNEISYNGLMVQGNKGDGKVEWYDINGKAINKYVEEQGEFLLQKIKEMMNHNTKIGDKNTEDVIYVISPFSNVAYRIAEKLKSIGFTRYRQGKPTNVGTIHTFQGKQAPIVFLVLGADRQSIGAAKWAVSEPNMINVAATRAKKEFYIIGDKKLYLSLGCDTIRKTYDIIQKYKEEHPELTYDNAQQA